MPATQDIRFYQEESFITYAVSVAKYKSKNETCLKLNHEYYW